MRKTTFKKGQSGNPNGRPKGAKDKIGANLRQMITDFLEENFPKIIADFAKLSPVARGRLFCDLLQYSLPKYQSMTFDFGFENLTDEQLNEIVNKLTQKAMENEKQK